MRELHNQEIENVSGGFGVPGAVFGGVTSAAGYLGNAATSGQFSTREFLTITGGGALGGAFGGAPASTAARFVIPRITAGAGALGGAVR